VCAWKINKSHTSIYILIILLLRLTYCESLDCETMSATFTRSAITGICSGAFQGATGVGGSIIVVSALSSNWGLKLPQVWSMLKR
jgi:hypothetical protein